MKIRLMGTSEECAEFINFLKKIIPDKIISISNAYINRNSIEQRVYVEFKDLSQGLSKDITTFAHRDVWSDILAKFMQFKTNTINLKFSTKNYKAKFGIELFDLKKIDE